MSKTIHVVGAGLTGLIVSNLLVARGYDVTVFELQEELPHNHRAVLRFRSPKLGDALGIEFEKVQALLCLSNYYYPNPLVSAMHYSRATNGIMRTDRSITRLMDGPKLVDRWIAPANLRDILLERIRDRVQFGTPHKIIACKGIVLTTVPMYSTFEHASSLKIKSWQGKEIEFCAAPYTTVTMKCNDMDAYGTVYNVMPNVSSPWTRLSITGSEIILEMSERWGVGCLDRDEVGKRAKTLAKVILFLALEIDQIPDKPHVYRSLGDRISPIDERTRKSFIMYLTDQHQVYSIGRFATWRPGMLLDDLIKDTAIVASMIEGNPLQRFEANK